MTDCSVYSITGKVFHASMCEMCRRPIGLFIWAIDNTLL